jgi:hypothetical protein
MANLPTQLDNLDNALASKRTGWVLDVQVECECANTNRANNGDWRHRRYKRTVDI